MEMENEAKPRQTALLKELGIGSEESREPYEPSEFERNVTAIRLCASSRLDPGQLTTGLPATSDW